VSSCRDGIGDEAYAELLAQAENPKDALLRITQGYKLGYHKAAKMAELSARASVQAVSELPAQRLKNLCIEKFSTPQEALDHALAQAKKRGIPKPKILILPDGCVTVPDVRGGV
jgi:nickel-dependent lactate racemase